MNLETELKQLGVTALTWQKANKAAKRSVCHELLMLHPTVYNSSTRQQRQDAITEYFERNEVPDINKKADYLKTVYKFREGKVLHCGMYEDITGGILNDIHAALKWKFPDTRFEETETILKSIK